MNNWKQKYEDEVKARQDYEEKGKAVGVESGRKEIADIFLDLLDLRGSYPSNKETRYYPFGGYSEIEVSGSREFVEDLLSAKDAINGQAQLKKIRKALKNKEEK